MIPGNVKAGRVISRANQEALQTARDLLQEILDLNARNKTRKHLPGSHDQSTHGSGGGRSINSTEAGEILFEEARIRLGGSDPESGALKSAVSKDIAARMSDVSTEDLIAADTQMRDRLKYYEQDLKLAIDPTKSGELVVRERFGKIEVLHTSGGVGSPDEGWMEPGSPEAIAAVRASCVSTMVQSWANTSNDTSATSLTLQEAAKSHFNLENTSPWSMTPEMRAEVDYRLATQGHVYTSFVRAQHEATQEVFKTRGISEIELHRGVGMSQERIGQTIAAGKVQLRPLSSFSGEYGVAEDFAPSFNQTTGDRGVIVTVKVPTNRILSMPATGVGCLGEWEFVVLGGEMPITEIVPLGD